MNPILQASIMVVIGTAICAFGTTGMLLLCMRIQGTPIGSAPDKPAETGQPSGTAQNSVVFEVEGKQVAVHIEVAGTPVRLQRL